MVGWVEVDNRCGGWRVNGSRAMVGDAGGQCALLGGDAREERLLALRGALRRDAEAAPDETLDEVLGIGQRVELKELHEGVTYRYITLRDRYIPLHRAACRTRGAA